LVIQTLLLLAALPLILAYIGKTKYKQARATKAVTGSYFWKPSKKQRDKNFSF
jgi:hypothetical protein